METLETTLAQQIATAASDFQQRQTGHAPESVTVVMGEETLVITLHGALSPAEKIMAQTEAGAALVQEYHRQLFAGSADALRKEITRITGIEVREAAAELEPPTGSVVHAFTTGTMVQVFHLAKRPIEKTSDDGPVPPTDFNHDAGNFADSTIPVKKEEPCPAITHP